MRWLPVLLLVMVSPAWGQQELQRHLDAHRKQINLSMPTLDEGLVASSQQRSQALASLGALSHRDQQGRGPGEQMVAEGQPPGTFGEILGAGASLDDVWQAWLASPSHRAILDEPGWTTWGWGVTSEGSTQVWVVRFRKP